MEELEIVDNQSPWSLKRSTPPRRPTGIKTQNTAAIPKISDAIFKV
tara:strand:+ start:25 stop:162 length:138 start_codon:yes stop_codon:yes gene_type:complete